MTLVRSLRCTEIEAKMWNERRRQTDTAESLMNNRIITHGTGVLPIAVWQRAINGLGSLALQTGNYTAEWLATNGTCTVYMTEPSLLSNIKLEIVLARVCCLPKRGPKLISDCSAAQFTILVTVNNRNLNVCMAAEYIPLKIKDSLYRLEMHYVTELEQWI